MKIAIFHNLKHGGGFEQIKFIINELAKLRVVVDVYSHQNIKIPNTNKTFYYPLNHTSNIFEHIYQVIVETNRIEKKIADTINSQNYDYVFVFPCHLQQTPSIIKFCPKSTTYYFYFESLREYYEQTSFDYFSLKKIISRIIRFPTKLQDLNNCSKAENIISNSYYSNYLLNKIYNRHSNVIYPGMRRICPQKKVIHNKHTSLSFGQLSMLKGHHISADINQNINIFGKESHEKLDIYIKNKGNLHSKNINNKDKNALYKKHTYFFANQINEPFGITTLEALQNNCYIIGRNEAGTCEIVNNGLNGKLYNVDDINLSKKVFHNVDIKKNISFYKTIEKDWSGTISNILYVTSYV